MICISFDFFFHYDLIMTYSLCCTALQILFYFAEVVLWCMQSWWVKLWEFYIILLSWWGGTLTYAELMSQIVRIHSSGRNHKEWQRYPQNLLLTIQLLITYLHLQPNMVHNFKMYRKFCGFCIHRIFKAEWDWQIRSHWFIGQYLCHLFWIVSEAYELDICSLAHFIC